MHDNLLDIGIDGSLVIRCRFEEKDIVKKTGARWERPSKVWIAAFTLQNVEFLVENLENVFITDGVEAKLEKIVSIDRKLQELKKLVKCDTPVQLRVPGVKVSLYNYQKLGVSYATSGMGGLLLGDEMGLGKSIQGISTACWKKANDGLSSCLVITPASLKWNWPLEIEKFTDEKYVVIDGPSEERIRQWLRKDVFFYIVNYELVLEDLFGGREISFKDDDSAKVFLRKEKMIAAAKARMDVLAPIRSKQFGMILIDECFHPDARVRCSDGVFRRISDIVVNRLSVCVDSYNESTCQIESKPVVGWFKNSICQCYRVITDGGVSYPTGNHNFYTPYGKKTVDELNVGDEILYSSSVDDFLVKERLMIGKIFLKEPYKIPCTTYNIEVADNHNYFVGNTLVANCHAIKNHNSKRTKNIKRLKADFRMALSGTPIDGKLEDLHSIMEWVAPGLLESKTRFLQKHAHFDFWGRVVRYRKIDEVREKIAPFFLRRLKKDVLKDLPDKVYKNRYVLLPSKELKIYKSLADRGHEVTEDAEAMTAVIRCKQFCDCPRLIDEPFDGAKLEAFKEILEEVVIENKHKALIFSQYSSMCEILCDIIKKMGLKYLYICGNTPKKERASMQALFNEDPTINLMIGTEAMSTGLNFTAADYVINYDDAWSPAIMSQRSDRCIIEGQLVQTSRGMIPIEQVAVGDRVLTHKGNFKRVLDVSNMIHCTNTTGKLTTEIDIRRYHEPLKTTHDHKILIIRDKNEPYWEEAWNIRPKDLLLSPILSGERRTPESLVLPERLSYGAVKRKIPLCNEVLFIFGWYLAEGCSSAVSGKGRFVSLSGHVKERPILENILRWSEQYFGVSGTIYGSRENGIELRLFSSELAEWFKEMFGPNAYEKRIPQDWIENWDCETLWKILQAYIECDGYERKKQVEWVTVSHCLAMQTIHIASARGFNPTMRLLGKGKNKGQWICGYTVNGESCSDLINKKVDGFSVLPVVGVKTYIEKSKHCIVYDLTVEDDHSFIVGMSIVHNCHRIGQKNVVTVVSFICRDTIEERICNVLKVKGAVSSKAMGDESDEEIVARLGAKDIAKLL